MITSIVLTDKYTIGMNSQKKILIDDNILSVEKDIPFIRYRFSKYDESDFTYIAESMKQFAFSTHLIEITLNSDAVTILNYIKNNNINIAKYIYIDITDADVEKGELNAEVLNQISFVKELGVDRYMFRDKSRTLDLVHVKAFIKQIKQMYNIDSSMFGVCSSPLSFGDLACLTAVKARELMSIYSTVADVALPSANHQCMNCCGCIRYLVVSENKAAPADTSSKKTPKVNKDGADKEKKAPVKSVKQSYQLHSFDL